MKNQQGAALVIVMALLSGALMIGISGMNSALIDERLAGNYRASVQAQMTAENIVSALASVENQAARENALRDCVKAVERGEDFCQLQGNEFEIVDNKITLRGDEIESILSSDITIREFVDELIPEDLKNDPDAQDQINEMRNDLLENLVVDVVVDEDSQTVTITARDEGLRNSARRSASLVYKYSGRGSNSDSWRQYQRGFIVCEGIRVGGKWGGGSAEFNSFDSRLEGGVNQNRKNAYLATRRWGGDVVLTGNGKVNGDVYSVGDLIFSGSSLVYGDAYVNGHVDFSGNYNALVHGDVIAETVTGNRSNVRDHVGGELTLMSGGAGLEELNATDSCDEQNVSGLYERYLNETGISSSGDLSVTDWNISEATVLSSEGLYDPHPNYSGDYVEIEVLNNESVVRIDNFNLAGSRVFQVGAKELPTNLVMLVENNFEISGGSRFFIEEGSSLTLIVKGKFSLMAGRKIEIKGDDLVIDNSGEPRAAFSLVSLYDDSKNDEGENAGVFVSGESSYYGEILAPYSHVNFVGSSHLYGSVYSRKLSVEGGNKFFYNEAFNSFSKNSNNSNWCTFSDLSPLTVSHPLESFISPSSNAAFDGSNAVPAISVAFGDQEKVDAANKQNGGIREGVEGGVFDDAKNAEKFDSFIAALRAEAQNSGTYISNSHDIKGQERGGKNNPFGEVGNEAIWFVDGGVSGNNLAGAGILVVNGNYDVNGNPEFNGLVIVLGNYKQGGGGGRDFKGALLVAPYDQNLNFTAASVEFSGGGSNDFIHDREALSKAFSLLDDELEETWNYCGEPEVPGNGELQWELIDWR